MKIGYTSDYLKTDVRILEKYGVERVVQADHNLTQIDSFKKFVSRNAEEQLVLQNLESIGEAVTLVQLIEVLLVIKQNTIRLVILEKGAANKLSDHEYIDFIYELACREKDKIRIRTKKGLAKAVSNGASLGRPAIDQETINRIKHYFIAEKKPYREIAALCNVSVGTVYKYSNMKNKRETAITD